MLGAPAAKEGSVRAEQRRTMSLDLLVTLLLMQLSKFQQERRLCLFKLFNLRRSEWDVETENEKLFEKLLL